MNCKTILLIVAGVCAGVGVASLNSQPPPPVPERIPGDLFVEGRVMGVALDHPRQHPLVFVITTDPNTVDRWPPGHWNVVDCSEIVPHGTKAVCLNSMLLISHGQQAATSNLTLAVRRHTSKIDNSGNYHAQAVEAHVSGGQRGLDSVWVALSRDGKFEFCWNKSNEPPPPGGSTFSINMSLTAYLR